MESIHTDASKFFKGGIYNTQEEALLGVLTTPIKTSKTQGQLTIKKEISDKFIKSFFPEIQKYL